MHVKIYIDDFFFVNSILDFVILEISSFIFWGKNISHKKNVCVAGVQGIILCIFFYIFGLQLLTLRGLSVFLCLINSFADGIVISREKNNIKKLIDGIKKVPVVVFVTFFLGGALNYIMYRTHIGVAIYLMLKKYGHAIMFICYFDVIMIIVYVTRKSIIYIRTEICRSKTKCRVVLKLNNRQIGLDAIIDTGNSLYEPVSKRPVSVVEQKAIALFMAEKIRNVYLIPYKSVGVEDGTVYGIEIDEMDVIIQGTKFTEKKIILGIYNGSLSSDNSYSMILNKCYCESISD